MPVLALGISHRRASVELLGRLGLSEEDYPKAYRRLGDLPAVHGSVVLSTCNRVEVYAEVDAYHAGFQDLKRFLADSSGLDPDGFAEPLYAHYEDDAAEHLFEVAAGIDSMILGEPQILDQVRDALRRAEAEGAAGTALGDLFRRAARVGRRAREETAIGASPSAFVEAGLGIAEGVVGPLDGASALVLGAGGMGALAVAALRARGATVRVANRTPSRAERLAARHGAEVASLEDAVAGLASADLAVSATGATEPVVTGRAVRRAISGRPGRPLFLLDLGVPRDVEPAAASIAGVTVVDIDGLRGAVVALGAEGEVIAVKALVRDEVRRLAIRRRAARLAPLIEALQARGELVRASELKRFGARLASLDPKEREAVEALTRRIVAKLLHDPVVGVKDLAREGDAHARALADLFGIDFPG